MARRRMFIVDDLVCKNAGVGNVFLNKSRASSSFRILIVSPIANISSARTLHRWFHSSSFVEQLFAISAKNTWFSPSAFLVSSRSSFNSTISRPSSAHRSVFDSIAFVFASSSLFFAAMRRSKSFTAFSSAAVMSANSFSMVSKSCFRIPTMSPLLGAYPVPCAKKADNMSRSAELMSLLMASCCKAMRVDERVCRNFPAIPLSIAAIAFFRAAMFAS
mmetsp:Transcript_56547/g.112450  ORF Transcript_56547/g.112450 Transcript_56547/m.112450 type:complete len:218 (-) Transcript_56547:470-1123(-)